MSEKVLFADEELTIHKAIGAEFELLSGAKVTPVVSETLLPGQYVSLADLPPYVRESATKGEIAGARVLTENRASAIAEEAARVRGEVVAKVDLEEEEIPVVELATKTRVEEEAKPELEVNAEEE